MGKLNLTIAIIVKSLLVLCLHGFSINASAASSSATTSDSEVAAKPVKKRVVKRPTLRDKDKKCLKCHKTARKTLLESHGEQAKEVLGKALSCSDCHNKISSKHRNGAPKVTKYAAAQSQAGAEKLVLSHAAVLKANQECTECHQPAALQEANWTHDVHAKNLTCSNCHTVHTSAKSIDVLTFDHKGRIKLCVDCHADFNQQNGAAKKDDEQE